MIPAIIAMLLVLVVGFLPTFNIVGEKERGTIEQVNVTPVGRFAFIFSKLIPYWVSGLFLIGYAMLVAFLAFGLAPLGGIAAVFCFAVIFILVISGFALIISNYSTTTQSAAFLMFFFLIIFILMSGLLTPVASMPQWAQWVSACNPFRYFMEAMRSIYLKGSTLVDLWPQLLTLSLFTSFIFPWAVLSYKKNS